MTKGNKRFHLLCIILILLLGVTSSCKKNVSMDVKRTAVFKVPADAPIGVPFIDSYSISTTSLQLDINDIKPSEVKKLYLQRLQLTITSPPGQNFNFLKSIKVYAYADGMPETLGAYMDDVPLNVNQLELYMTNASLAEIANKESFYIKAEAVFDEAPTNEIYISTLMDFYIKARVSVF